MDDDFGIDIRYLISFLNKNLFNIYLDYIGCYPDATNSFLDGVEYIDRSKLTARACITFCLNYNYLYAGLKLG